MGVVHTIKDTNFDKKRSLIMYDANNNLIHECIVCNTKEEVNEQKFNQYSKARNNSHIIEIVGDWRDFDSKELKKQCAVRICEYLMKEFNE